MTLPEIQALPVARLLRPGGAAVIWCTWPQFFAQVCIIELCWGLRIKTGGAWAKRTINGKFRWGPGHIHRSVCEPWVLAIRGNGHGPAGPRVKNMIETMHDMALDGLARRHSQKPEEMYSLIEALTPNADRADVYSRQSAGRPGWHLFGDEIGKFDEATP